MADEKNKNENVNPQPVTQIISLDKEDLQNNTVVANIDQILKNSKVKVVRITPATKKKMDKLIEEGAKAQEDEDERQ